MKLSDCESRYQTIAFQRENDVLQVTLHSRGSEALWGTSEQSMHNELGLAVVALAMLGD